ncbi:MAG: hypothetical protein HRU33_07445 [Rhodobacteraceae bacterium]|nr:hypothetical protein [Paracoccaceae bacterium]
MGGILVGDGPAGATQSDDAPHWVDAFPEGVNQRGVNQQDVTLEGGHLLGGCRPPGAAPQQAGRDLQQMADWAVLPVSPQDEWTACWQDVSQV